MNLILQERKIIKMKRDVGIVCQKVHKQGRIKVMVRIQSLIHHYIFSQRAKVYELGFVYLPSLLSFIVCVLFGMLTSEKLAQYVSSHT